MMRNDYRRSLILFRSSAAGYSGHVRLERRTLMGTMYFLVQSPADCPTLRAALVGRGRDGAYYACALGEMQRDARGQAVLGYSFDPRNVCGRELEQYSLIAITCAGDASCEILLSGNVCGHAEFSWDGVREALCALYSGVAQGDIPVQEPVAGLPGGASSDMQTGVAAENNGSADAPAAVEGTAAALLEARGIRFDAPWPEAAEPLRALFQSQAALADAPDDLCVYVQAPMPEGSGYPFVAAGLLAVDGALAAVRYALPAAWSEEPPAGLEEYAWVGGQSEGWWVTEVPL